MKRRHSTALAGIATSALVFTLAPTTATATGGSTQAPPEDGSTKQVQRDDKPNPLGDTQRRLREEAVDKLVKGEADVVTRGGKKVIEIKGAKDGKGNRKKSKYVEYDVNREASVFTVLTDFGDKVKSPQGGAPGPVHNRIPKPDRNWNNDATDNNSTIWQSDFDREHYQDLMFAEDKESFRDFYLKQSNGRFSTTGDVSDWVKVPYNEARYGHNPAKGDGTSEAEGYWNYIKDTAQAWYDDQVDQGKSLEEIKAYLRTFDQWDRYDHDGDGDFDEPDGYIDHFQAIHAGEGEEAGGGAEGEDAIWSHRWYAFSTGAGKSGPTGNLLGGVPVGDSGLWIGDYTTEPENGGLGVFTHEFGHDLGLPDLYDTAGGDNGTGFWTLMSAGSWLNDGTEDIGSKPGYMGAWEKLQLGWLDVRTIDPSKKRTTTAKLGPADRDDKKRPQALSVLLPEKSITTEYNTPHSGSMQWWGGSADDLNSTLTRSIDLTGKKTASVSAWTWYDIEQGYDFLYGQVSTDGGATWTDAGSPISGVSRSWAQKTWDLSKWAGQKVDFRFRYATDGGVHEDGPFLDDITVTADGATLLSDDVESGDNGWTAKGFERMDGSTTETIQSYYLAENRVYSGYDKYLKTGPYNFGWSSTKPDWVERFPYQNGLLVWYINNEYSDNNTIDHPGYGQALPVDARPTPITFPDGSLLGNRRQPFDATFGLERTDPVTFHKNGTATSLRWQAAIPKFDDTNVDKYWSAKNPQGSTKVAGSGTTIEVLSGTGDNMQVQVSRKR